MDVLSAIADNEMAQAFAGKEINAARSIARQMAPVLKAIRARRGRPSMSKNAKRKKRMKMVGEEPGTDLGKVTQFKTDGYTSRNSNILVGHNALLIPRSDGTMQLNSRLRDVIFLSGIKVCMTIRNTMANVQDALYCNVALVSAKNRGGLGGGDDFFRNYDGTNRQIDFADTSLNALDRHCYPINADEHTIHWHKRFILKNDDTANTTGYKEFAKTYTLEKYAKINRQIRFEDSGANPETTFMLLYWVGRVGDNTTNSNIPVTNAYQADVKMLTVFKEPTPVMNYRKRW